MTAPALILAAGRGQRMRPLTDTCPKPLLTVRGRPLIDWWLAALARAGVQEAVVNTAWLGDQLRAHLARVDAPLLYFSEEGRDFGHALETAGGITRALPRLAPHPGDVFWALAADIHAPEFAFDAVAVHDFIASGRLAHLWLVPNPSQHPRGDFWLTGDGLLHAQPVPAAQSLTFSAVGLYRRELFELPWCSIAAGNPAGVSAPLAPLLRKAMAAGQVGGTLYTGLWADVGTPERLAALNRSTIGE